MNGVVFVGMAGEELTLEEWGALYEDYPRRVIASTVIGEDSVLRTVWLGGPLPDPVFGSALFRAGGIAEVGQYDTHEAAVAGHNALVARMAGELADEPP